MPAGLEVAVLEPVLGISIRATRATAPGSSAARKLCQLFAVPLLKAAVTWPCSRITGQVKITHPVSAAIAQVTRNGSNR